VGWVAQTWTGDALGKNAGIACTTPFVTESVIITEESDRKEKAKSKKGWKGGIERGGGGRVWGMFCTKKMCKSLHQVHPTGDMVKTQRNRPQEKLVHRKVRPGKENEIGRRIAFSVLGGGSRGHNFLICFVWFLSGGGSRSKRGGDGGRGRSSPRTERKVEKGEKPGCSRIFFPLHVTAGQEKYQEIQGDGAGVRGGSDLGGGEEGDRGVLRN